MDLSRHGSKAPGGAQSSAPAPARRLQRRVFRRPRGRQPRWGALPPLTRATPQATAGIRLEPLHHRLFAERSTRVGCRLREYPVPRPRAPSALSIVWRGLEPRALLMKKLSRAKSCRATAEIPGTACSSGELGNTPRKTADPQRTPRSYSRSLPSVAG